MAQAAATFTLDPATRDRFIDSLIELARDHGLSEDAEIQIFVGGHLLRTGPQRDVPRGEAFAALRELTDLDL
ncbi:MAG TPA: hypothetical protein VNC78_00440 [Actinomycetota bacterium]|nr:hypothetical protein [Actinomycetota bacterium]